MNQGRRSRGEEGFRPPPPPPPPPLPLFTKMTIYFLLVRGTYEEIKKKKRKRKNFRVEI